MTGIYEQRAAEFLKRLPSGSPARYRENIEVVFRLAEQFSAKVDNITADRSLTDIGKAGAVKKLWGSGSSAHLAQIKTSVAKELADLKQQRASLYPKAPDRTDMFGEMQRQEVRTWLRGLDDATRRRAALEADDPVVQEAILFAPPEMSGLTPEIKQRVVEGAVEKQFGSRLKELDALEEGVGNVDAAIRITEAEIARLPGLSGIREAA